MPDGAHHGTGTRNDETRVGLEPAVEGILDDEDELDITQPRSVVRLPVTTSPVEPIDADAEATLDAPSDLSQAEIVETPTADEAAATAPDGDQPSAQAATADDHAAPTLDDELSATVDAFTDLDAAAETPIEGPLDAPSLADESESALLAEELDDPARLREPEEAERDRGDEDDEDDRDDELSGHGEEDAPAGTEGTAEPDAARATVAGGDEAERADSAALDDGDGPDMLPAAVPVAGADTPSEGVSEQHMSGTDIPLASPEMPAATAFGQRAGPTLPLPSRRDDATAAAFGVHVAPDAEAAAPPAPAPSPIVAVETQPEAPPPAANGMKPKPVEAAEQAALADLLLPPAGEATPADVPPPQATPAPVGRATPANMAPLTPAPARAPSAPAPAQVRRNVVDVSGIHSQVPRDYWLDNDPLENMRRSLALKGARPVTLEAGRPLPKPSRFKRAPRWLSFVVLLVVLAVIALCAGGVASFASSYLRHQRNTPPVPAATSVPATTTSPATP